MALSSLSLSSGLVVTPVSHIVPPLPEPVCIVASRPVVSGTASGPIALTEAVSIFPTTDVMAASVLGFGKEFTGYKNPNTAERDDIVELPPPKTDFKAKYGAVVGRHGVRESAREGVLS